MSILFLRHSCYHDRFETAAPLPLLALFLGSSPFRPILARPRPSLARLYTAQPFPGPTRLGPTQLGSARLGPARPSPTRLDSARPGPARLGPTRLDSARLGSARLGSARLGSARLSSARLGWARPGSARLDSARLGPRSTRHGSPRSGRCGPEAGWNVTGRRRDLIFSGFARNVNRCGAGAGSRFTRYLGGPSGRRNSADYRYIGIHQSMRSGLY